jgi:hypothetical protein
MVSALEFRSENAEGTHEERVNALGSSPFSAWAAALESLSARSALLEAWYDSAADSGF